MTAPRSVKRKLNGGRLFIMWFKADKEVSNTGSGAPSSRILVYCLLICSVVVLMLSVTRKTSATASVSSVVF